MEALNDVITSEMPSLKAKLHSLPTITAHVHRLWLDTCTDIIQSCMYKLYSDIQRHVKIYTMHVIRSSLQDQCNPLTDILLTAHMTQSFRMNILATMTDATETAIPLRQSENRSPREKQAPKLILLLVSM